MEKFLGLGRDKLEAMRAEALAKHEYLTAVLARFRIDLEDAERDRVLRTSKK